MKIENMKTKSYYKVQLIAKTKTIKITKQEFKTKAEGIEKGVSIGYDILNLKAVNKLLCDGWTEYQPKEENTTETIVEVVEAVQQPKQKFDPKIEEQIRKNYIRIKERKGVDFVKGASIPNEPSDAVKAFLSTPPKQPTYKPLSVEKYALTDKQYKSNVEAVKHQRESYCGEVI